jgi:molybdopterin synthase sulfur carrier subunit
MARVWIPSLLRELTGGCEAVNVPGASVRQVIDELDRLHPGARDRLCDGDALRRGLAVVVDSEVARLGLLQPVKPDSEVHFLPAIGGGSGTEVAPPPADRRSPLWVLVLVLVLHAEMWAAAALSLFVMVPRMLRFEETFSIRLPYTTEQVLKLALGFMQFPPLFVVLPVIDVVVLVAMHRTAARPLLRIAWSAVVVGVILLLLIWVAGAYWLMMTKLTAAFSKQPPQFVPPVPGP